MFSGGNSEVVVNGSPTSPMERLARGLRGSHMSFANDQGITLRPAPITTPRANDGQGMEVKLARSFWRTVERMPAGASVSGGANDQLRTIVVVSGWIAETRILPDGRRQ